MKPVTRESLLDYVTYEERRDEIRRRVLEAKAPRRIHVAGVLTFLFENADTIRYQVQEMMRAERIVKEADIAHELATYNELLGGPGELGCTLLVEIDDPQERAARLSAWVELPWHVYVAVPAASGGPLEKVYARFDERQVGEGRVSSVQYLKFATGGRVPLAVGVDLGGHLEGETRLDEAQRAALAADLAD
jgi:hypothetical protein